MPLYKVVLLRRHGYLLRVIVIIQKVKVKHFNCVIQRKKDNEGLQQEWKKIIWQILTIHNMKDLFFFFSWFEGPFWQWNLSFWEKGPFAGRDSNFSQVCCVLSCHTATCYICSLSPQQIKRSRKCATFCSFRQSAHWFLMANLA